MNLEIIFIILFSSWMVFWFVKNNRKESEPPSKEYKVTICPGALQRLIEAAFNGHWMFQREIIGGRIRLLLTIKMANTS